MIAYIERGDGPGVLLLHGIGGRAEGFRGLAEALAAAGFRAVAWDMPGYGGSPLPEHGLTIPELAGAALDLAGRKGMTPVHLVGHSLGGMIALEAAALRPGAVASLALLGSAAAFGSKDGAFQERFLAERLGPLDAGRTMAELADGLADAMMGPNADPAGRAEARAAMAATSPAAYRAAVLSMLGFDRRAQLAELAMPVLCLAGALDGNAPPAGVERMAAKVPGGRFVQLPGVGHLMHLEAPAATAAALLAFLADARRPAAEGGA